MVDFTFSELTIGEPNPNPEHYAGEIHLVDFDLMAIWISLSLISSFPSPIKAYLFAFGKMTGLEISQMRLAFSLQE